MHVIVVLLLFVLSSLCVVVVTALCDVQTSNVETTRMQ